MIEPMPSRQARHELSGSSARPSSPAYDYRARKKPVTLMFEERINVVWGASNSGKSYIVKALDLMSGAKTPSCLSPKPKATTNAGLSLSFL